MFRRLNTAEFREKIETQGYTLIDIRTAQEQVIFWVISEQQKHIDIYKPEALENIKKLPRDGKYLIYCYHGNRSQQVWNLMEEIWFLEIYDLEWGIDEWGKSS
jgi:rhodanese-related sulfurtransferase